MNLGLENTDGKAQKPPQPGAKNTQLIMKYWVTGDRGDSPAFRAVFDWLPPLTSFFSHLYNKSYADPIRTFENIDRNKKY